MVGFGNLLGGIERQSALWNRGVDRIVHDRQHEFASAIRFWHQMFANAREDAVMVPFSGKLVLRRVFGSHLEISSARECAGIQIIDVILWLFARSLKEDLPPNCQRLLDYVHSRAHADDFSFANAAEHAGDMVDALQSTEMSPELEARARALGGEIERRRLAGMAQYANEKAGQG